MGRPKLVDRDAVKATVLTLKLTQAERERLDELVAQREGELAELTGQRIEVSASAFIRWLMDERAKSVGMAKGPQPRLARATSSRPQPKRAVRR